MMQPNAVATAGSMRRSAAGRREADALAGPALMWRDRSCEEVQAVADLEQARCPDADCQQQDHALEQRLPERLQIEDEEEVPDGAEGKRAEDCADGASRSAEQRD